MPWDEVWTGDCVTLETAGGLISSLQTIPADANLPWISPGFIDLQVNGYGGIGFNDSDLSADRIALVVNAMTSFGVTTFLLTRGFLSFTAHYYVSRHSSSRMHSQPYPS